MVLTELGMESLEERLQSAVSSPARPPYKLSTLITESTPRVRRFTGLPRKTFHAHHR